MRNCRAPWHSHSQSHFLFYSYYYFNFFLTYQLPKPDRAVEKSSKRGRRIPFFTSVVTVGPGKLYTGYGYYDSEALKSAGYSIINSVVTTTTCPTTSSTPTLPPSPTGSLCSPHGDHCE